MTSSNVRNRHPGVSSRYGDTRPFEGRPTPPEQGRPSAGVVRPASRPPPPLTEWAATAARCHDRQGRHPHPPSHHDTDSSFLNALSSPSDPSWMNNAVFSPVRRAVGLDARGAVGYSSGVASDEGVRLEREPPAGLGPTRRAAPLAQMDRASVYGAPPEKCEIAQMAEWARFSRTPWQVPSLAFHCDSFRKWSVSFRDGHQNGHQGTCDHGMIGRSSEPIRVSPASRHRRAGRASDIDDGADGAQAFTTSLIAWRIGARGGSHLRAFNPRCAGSGSVG